MDLVLGPFADAHVERMPAKDLARLEAILEFPDTDLTAWIMGHAVPGPDVADRELIDRIRSFQQARAAQQ